MKRLTLVVLLLLQEQINALPEDLADMMCEHGSPMTEKEVGKLARRLASSQVKRATLDGAPKAGGLVEFDRSPGVAVALNRSAP